MRKLFLLLMVLAACVGGAMAQNRTVCAHKGIY